MILISYIKKEKTNIVCFALMILIFAVVGHLGEVRTDIYIYEMVLCLIAYIVFFLAGFRRYSLKVRKLREALKTLPYSDERLPEPSGLDEELYLKIVFEAFDLARDVAAKADRQREEAHDYYSMWVHQIKTPITALSLLVQASSDPHKGAMKTGLIHIEEYANMVLQYMRLEDVNTDFSFSTVDVDKVINEVIKKYSIFFIRRHISLDYEPVGLRIKSDEKWLEFIISQILSNSLKYTENGRIAIYLENPGGASGGKSGINKVPEGEDTDKATIVIEDSGIGIRKEDLPRIFERGFTGFNGRAKKQATGIGLYLCNMAAKKINITFDAESEPGSGTRIKIHLPYKNVRYE